MASSKADPDRRSPQNSDPSRDPLVHLQEEGFLLDIPGLCSGPWLASMAPKMRPEKTPGGWELSNEDRFDYPGDSYHYRLYTSKGPTVKRHILWLPEDKILLLADEVHACGRTGGPGGEFVYRTTLPIDGPAVFEPDSLAREIYAVGARRKVLARIVPLTHPEGRSDRRAGDFSLTGEGLVLTAAGRNRLFAAILIDFEPTRVGRRVKMTWRRLTVGENSEKADDAVAVGFRYHAGGDQYLIYRSLEQAAPRSVLGEHILDGFVVSRFTPNEEADYVFRQP